MNRRKFLASTTTMTAAACLIGKSPRACSAPASPGQQEDPCIPGLDYISAEATGCLRYEHFHRFSIPVSALIAPPAEGFIGRTTTLDQLSLDVVALHKFLEDTGFNEKMIRFHSHEVKITPEQLERIAQGEKEVAVEVKTPKGNFGHIFYFTASQSALIKIVRARSGGE
ncbi:MAG: hypothetical protein KDD22_07545 [Bdellovibrionales bacterium]|nr:hypothetical protein [Bdellovibrionales bacterium]